MTCKFIHTSGRFNGYWLKYWTSIKLTKEKVSMSLRLIYFSSKCFWKLIQAIIKNLEINWSKMEIWRNLLIRKWNSLKDKSLLFPRLCFIIILSVKNRYSLLCFECWQPVAFSIYFNHWLHFQWLERSVNCAGRNVKRGLLVLAVNVFLGTCIESEWKFFSASNYCFY